MLLKKIGNTFIFLAILIIGYVAYEQIYSFYLEKKLIMNTEELSLSLRKEMKTKGMGDFSSEMETKESKVDELPNANITEKKQEQLLLEIPKIDLETIVLEGTTNDILRVSVGHLEGSGQLGEIDQNYVLLGHRSYITGKFFNKLNDLILGDQINFKGSMEYSYKVINKKIIAPTQLEVLNPIKGKSIVTLITCHPEYSNKQRLVVVLEKVD